MTQTKEVHVHGHFIASNVCAAARLLFRDALPPRFEEVCRLYASGQLSVRKAAKELGMSKSSFYRKCRQFLDASEAESGENRTNGRTVRYLGKSMKQSKTKICQK